MENKKNKLEEEFFAAEFLKFPIKGSAITLAYSIGTQYQNLKEKLEKIFAEETKILPEFPLVSNMIRREIFPISSLEEYHRLTDQKIINEFERQIGGDPRKGLSQGYLITGTIERMIHNETGNYIEATRSNYSLADFCKKKGLGEEYNPKERLLNTIAIADRLKPVVWRSINESLTNRLRNL